jgi:ketopantoate reductase
MAVSKLGKKYGVPTPRIDLMVEAYKYLLADKAELDGPEFEIDMKEIL